MKLKLPKKQAAEAAETPKEDTKPVVENKKEKPNLGKIVTDEHGQRRYNTTMFSWAEVFSTKDVELANRVKVEFTRKLMSVFLLFDADQKDYLLMTTETFYSEARRLILELDQKPWGVGDE